MIGLSALIALALLLLAPPSTAAAPAGAAYPPASRCAVRADLDPATGVLTLTGSGYSPFAHVRIQVDGTVVEQVVTDTAGTFSTSRPSAPPAGTTGSRSSVAGSAADCVAHGPVTTVAVSSSSPPSPSTPSPSTHSPAPTRLLNPSSLGGMQLPSGLFVGLILAVVIGAAILCAFAIRSGHRNSA